MTISDAHTDIHARFRLKALAYFASAWLAAVPSA